MSQPKSGRWPRQISNPRASLTRPPASIGQRGIGSIRPRNHGSAGQTIVINDGNQDGLAHLIIIKNQRGRSRGIASRRWLDCPRSITLVCRPPWCSPRHATGKPATRVTVTSRPVIITVISAERGRYRFTSTVPDTRRSVSVPSIGKQQRIAIVKIAGDIHIFVCKPEHAGRMISQFKEFVPRKRKFRFLSVATNKV